jgi:hypothetical protein
MDYIIAFLVGYYVGIKVYEWIFENDKQRR